MNEGTTIWLTGLSGSGKTTLARQLEAELISRGARVEVLDGDIIRTNLSKGLGYTVEDRNINIRRIGFVSNLLSRNGVVAIVAAISPYKKTRDEVRAMHEGRFVELFVDCPLDILVKRDVKGLYKRALRGEIKNFTGISDPYEPPEDPEIIVKSDQEDEQESVAKVLAWLERNAGLPRPASQFNLSIG